MRFIHLIIFSVFTMPGWAQASLAINQSFFNYKLPTLVQSSSELKFGEFTIRIGSKSFRLHKGQYKRYSYAKGGLEYYLSQSWVIKSADGKPRFALVDIMELVIGGSSAATEYVQLLSL